MANHSITSSARASNDGGIVRSTRRPEAHDLLAPIYTWFIEGLGTPDHKEAKALLDELRG